MLLTSGAYLVMIGVNRQAQGITTGINNLSFALEVMARTIRTGTQYTCPSSTNECVVNSFSFTDADGVTVSYSLAGSAIQQNIGGTGLIDLTDPMGHAGVVQNSLGRRRFPCVNMRHNTDVPRSL